MLLEKHSRRRRVTGLNSRRDRLRPTSCEIRIESIPCVHRHAIPQSPLGDAQATLITAVPRDENPRDTNVLRVSNRAPQLTRLPNIGQFVVCH